MKRMRNDPDMLEEYDFTGGVRGKYAKRYAEGTNVVVIDPDVAEYFPDHDSVNAALRSLAEIIKRKQEPKTSPPRGRTTARAECSLSPARERASLPRLRRSLFRGVRGIMCLAQSSRVSSHNNPSVADVG